MASLRKLRGRMALGYAALAIMALPASSRAEVVFDSLSSPNSGVVGDPFEGILYAASFNTGSSAVQLTDVALLLNSTFSLPGDTFTVTLFGGAPLADVTFVDGLGLIFNSPIPDLRSVTLPISDLSANLTVEHFGQLTNIVLQPNSFYAIGISVSTQSADDLADLGWGSTNDNSGPGVIDGYNSSYITDNDFFPNKPTPSPNNGGPIFQMEISGVATPEPSTWAMMALGFGALGFMGWRGSREIAERSA